MLSVVFRSVVFALVGWLFVAFLVMVSYFLVFPRIDEPKTGHIKGIDYWDKEFNVD